MVDQEDENDQNIYQTIINIAHGSYPPAADAYMVQNVRSISMVHRVS